MRPVSQRMRQTLRAAARQSALRHVAIFDRDATRDACSVKQALCTRKSTVLEPEWDVVHDNYISTQPVENHVNSDHHDLWLRTFCLRGGEANNLGPRPLRLALLLAGNCLHFLLSVQAGPEFHFEKFAMQNFFLCRRNNSGSHILSLVLLNEPLKTADVSKK